MLNHRLNCLEIRNPQQGMAVVCRDIDFMVMHAPFHKIVRKGFARLLPIDRLSQEMGEEALSSAQILDREASVVSQ